MEDRFTHIVAEVDGDDTSNWSDFVEYAYDICRQAPESYQQKILRRYIFTSDYYNHALLWITALMSQHTFAKYLMSYCIGLGYLGEMHWRWKYVQGLGGGMPTDCAMIFFESEDALHVWAEYGSQVDQPLAPFAKLAYTSITFRQSYRCDRFLIFTLSGFDNYLQQDTEIELRVYTDKCRDEDGDVYFSDRDAMFMANEFVSFLDRLKAQNIESLDLLDQDELDALLMVANDEPDEGQHGL